MSCNFCELCYRLNCTVSTQSILVILVADSENTSRWAGGERNTFYPALKRPVALPPVLLITQLHFFSSIWPPTMRYIIMGHSYHPRICQSDNSALIGLISSGPELPAELSNTLKTTFATGSIYVPGWSLSSTTRSGST